MEIKVVVVCEDNVDGSRVLDRQTLNVTQDQYDEGAHYDLAVEDAKSRNLIPYFAFDQFDEAYKSITAESLSELVNLKSLPLGARFKYQGGDQVWVLTSRADEGTVVKWDGNILNYFGQSICSAADSPQEFESLMVYPV